MNTARGSCIAAPRPGRWGEEPGSGRRNRAIAGPEGIARAAQQISASTAQLASYNAPPSPQQAPPRQGRTIDAYSGDVDKQHEQMVRWFEESEMARMDEIELAQRDREYYDHNQWTKPELDALKARGQPPIVINKIHDKVSLLCGLERKARTNPKAFPRTPNEDERADAATQALRYHLRLQQLRRHPQPGVRAHPGRGRRRRGTRPGGRRQGRRRCHLHRRAVGSHLV